MAIVLVSGDTVGSSGVLLPVIQVSLYLMVNIILT